MAAITTQEFEHHFKSLYKPLCLFALRYTDQVDDAEDIVQPVSYTHLNDIMLLVEVFAMNGMEYTEFSGTNFFSKN